MGRIMRNSDAISAKEGTVFITIDGKVHEYAELIKFEARVDYTKAEVKSVGKRMKGNKIVGAEGAGSMEIHYHRPEMRRMALQYLKTGKSPIFDVQVVNSDITSRAGKQTTLIKNIVPDGALLASLDGDSEDLLKDETDFTFDDFDFLDQFKVLND
ncbi:phage tail tube protein [Cytobacillus purgationiresistens]|uniref:dTDP-4-amino-4,6-dideoxygalactose transaminase n=1 Tax=Cytobacillus purgationiresistens TaxID=863449 RepID=A0ABU0AF94_9BACI|nr:phage tail tube protein [Cytobacillus purgationiresistens]MDQ0269937.1 dTDP-4-amino-4,6-dideoxygalactose transaminase [Cytobacillus purgationiresistens]